jgi:hypothetical protein
MAKISVPSENAMMIWPDLLGTIDSATSLFRAACYGTGVADVISARTTDYPPAEPLLTIR